MHGTAVEEPPVSARSETAAPPDSRHAVEPGPTDGNIFNSQCCSRRCLECHVHGHLSPRDRHGSLVEEAPALAHLEPPEFSEPEPVAQDHEFYVSNAEPDEPWGSLSEGDRLACSVLSMGEQFRLYGGWAAS